jgi:hypothetical protein
MDKALLEAIWSRLAAEPDGMRNLRARLLGAFLKAHGSLAAFVEGKAGDIRGYVLETAESCLAECVRELDVASVIRKVCSNGHRLRSYLRQCVGESQGRIRFQGGAPRDSKWIKALAASDTERAQQFLPRVAVLDHSPGEWTPVAVPGNDQALYFVQYVAGLSPRCLVQNGTRVAQHSSVAALVRSGLDPVTALLPGFRPTRQDACAALVKAWALGMVEVADGQGVFLTLDGDRRVLGKDFVQAIARLRKSYDVLVRISVVFACAVARDGNSLSSRVAGLQNGQAFESIRQVVGEGTVQRAFDEVSELRRYFRIAAPSEELHS